MASRQRQNRYSIRNSNQIMKPILIATPRSGSTIIGEQIGNLAEQWWGYKNYLHEYFSVSPYYRSEITKAGKMLFFEYLGPAPANWCTDPKKERLRRKDLIGTDTNYMIKCLPGNFAEGWLTNWIKENYNTPIFLDRRDRFNQLMSWMAFRTVKVSHWHRDSENRIQSIDYKPEYVEEFVEMIKTFKKIRSEFENPVTIYYEDWMNGGSSQRALIKMLGWDETKTFVKMITTTQSTPYVGNVDNMVTNKFEWSPVKFTIQKMLKELDE